MDNNRRNSMGYVRTDNNRWNSLGDVRELRRKAERMQQIEDMADWGEKTLRLIADIRYLNGCVKRGRGADIDPNCPVRNVLEYIKELESKINQR